ncbi:phosphoglycerate dehydrogenase [Modestobacter sp. I12A-02628]|uniref:D-3-phosphoglycerate dehydrogenase n=1 Tax=Goekera deserti TaxID=2497753 RepID=A0A7K3WGX0_9ACTN|nr:phosphoglycerate dehydrogenase [Goekera deserti]MPQ97312.1 phosphoglycerate dehydrogenase [Goekera deserti]NDI50177.1 phosphoglycerate dehydrogenase [Goekera deserti]NEL55745.1 phosphoglycerate dehydrogenase [Goekera deserti]
MPKALLLENIDPVATDLLGAAGYEVERLREALGEDDLVAALDGVDLLGIRSQTQVTADVLRRCPGLTAVGAFCIGTNQVDLAAAAAAGVAVFNAPYSNTRSVVELALAEIICLARRLVDRDRSLHAGTWDKSAAGSHEVRGRTIGIVGYGNIGSQLSVLAEALGMRVLFYDLEQKLALGNAEACASLEELLERAETVTLHVDGRAGNAGMFGAEQFAMMRPRSLFLNLSRGFVVDHEALREHVLSGHIAGAAIDVFPDEPREQGDPFDSVLRGLPNVVLTPHVGGSTQEAQHDIGRFVAGKLLEYRTAGTTTLSVNLPTAALYGSSATRFAVLHRNVPGVLARVTALVGGHGLNVDGQVLATRGELGYVLADVSAPLPPDLLTALQEMPETVRVTTYGP